MARRSEFDEVIDEELRRRQALRSPVGVPDTLQGADIGVFQPRPPGTGAYSTPEDPAVDTFRRRFYPFLPMQERIEENLREKELTKPQPLHPKRRGQYGPIAEGPSATATDAGPEEPARPKLPPGFKFADEVPQEPPRPKLPEGFRFADEKPLQTPAVNAGISQIEGDQEPAPSAGSSQIREAAPEDPFERAAMRQRLGVRPPEGRREGGFTEAIESIPGVIGEGIVDVGKVAEKGFTTGQVDPGEALSAVAQVTPISPAYKTLRTITDIARRRAATPLQEAAEEIGATALPRVVEQGPVKRSIAAAVSGAPIGGAPLRESARMTTQQVRSAIERAAARPTGEAVTQDVAGAGVRQNIKEELAHQKRVQQMNEGLASQIEAEKAVSESLKGVSQVPRGVDTTGVTSPIPTWKPTKLLDEPNIPPKVKSLLGRSDEDIVANITTMASETKKGADIATLAKLRNMVGREEWAGAQSAVMQRLGTSARSAEFEPATWVANYGNLSDKGKTVLFGPPGSELRRHLDAIETVAKRAPDWQRFERERGLLTSRFGAGSLLLAGIGGGTGYATDSWWVGAPLAVLGTVVPIGLVARSMAKPAVAASISQWSKAYEGVVRSAGGPQAVASFVIATRNLGKNLGVEIDPDTILRGPKNEQPLE